MARLTRTKTPKASAKERKPKRRERKGAEEVVETTNAPVQEVDPGIAIIPASSYNLMTVRYATEQRRSLVAIVLAGAFAAAALLMVGSWLTIRAAEADARDQAILLDHELSTLSNSITELSDTGGLNPSEVERLARDRLAAFDSATSGEVDYKRLLADLSSYDTSRAWIQSVAVAIAPPPAEATPADSSGEGGEPPAPAAAVRVEITGRAVTLLDVNAWYNAVNQGLGYGTIEQQWPSTSATGAADGLLSFNATLLLDATIFMDRAESYGVDRTLGAETRTRQANQEVDPEETSDQPSEGATP